MKKCISLEIPNIQLIIIILATVIFYIINESIFGFNFGELFSPINLNQLIFDDNSKHHRLIEPMFNYIGTIIMSIIFLLLQNFVFKNKKVEYDEDNNIIKITIKSNLDKSLIHTEGKQKINIFYFLIMIFVWVIDENLIIIISNLLKELDFWFFELIFLSLMLKYFIGIEIHKHHWFAMLLSIITCSLLKITTIIITFTTKNRNSEMDYIELYLKRGYFVPIGLIGYLIFIFIRSLYITWMKYFFDLKYVSHIRLLLLYGCIGTIILGALSFCTSYINCKEIIDNDIINDICPFESSNNEEKSYYFDSFSIYFNNFEGKKVLLIIFGAITFFFNKYFNLLLIMQYNPVYAIFSTPIIFFLEKVFLLIYTLIDTHKPAIYKGTNSLIKYTKLILDTIGDIFNFFGFVIYLEIIVFHCYGLNYNIHKNIVHRSNANYKYVGKINESYFPINPENEEEENN